MHQIPTQSPKFHSVLPKNRIWKITLCVVLFVAALVVSMSAGLAVKHHLANSTKTHTASQPQQSLTLYYNDGKTVLWKSDAPSSTDARAFVAYVRQQLPDILGSDYQAKGAWQVTTTLDRSLQTAALNHIQDKATKITSIGAQNVALVAEEVGTGNVVSWVGSLEGTSDADMASQKVEIGSLELPLTYAAYMNRTSKGIDTQVNDSQGPVPDYPCTNTSHPNQGGNCAFDYDQRYLGAMTLYEAIVKARQVPAISLANEIGVQTTIDTVAAMGGKNKCYADEALAQEVSCYAASAIGDGVFAKPHQILQAYATLANKGSNVSQAVVTGAILNGTRQDIARLPALTQPISKTVASSVVAALSDNTITSPLHPVAALFTTPKGVKTALVDGTTFSDHVASSLQFSQKYVVGFWMSSSVTFNNAPESVTLPLTAAWMNDAQ